MAYQKKLQQLDGKQQELVKDNFELKDLCLYLDEERNNQVCPSNPEKPITITSQESCVGDRLSCPECGYGPIWTVSRSSENGNVNISLTEENEDTKKEKDKNVSGNHFDKYYFIKRTLFREAVHLLIIY